MLWNADDGALVARVGTETEFVLPPVFSADGGYVAIAERVDGANPLYSVLRSADASLVAQHRRCARRASAGSSAPAGATSRCKGPETVVRVLETRRGAELGRLAHAHAVERLLHSTDGAVLLTVDRAGAIAAWPLAAARAELGRPLGPHGRGGERQRVGRRAAARVHARRRRGRRARRRRRRGAVSAAARALAAR